MDETLDERTSGDRSKPIAEQPALTTDHLPLTTSPRVILFDIDGTLIKAVRRPEYRGAMREILMDVFGTCGRIGEVEFAGKTDLAIYREALEPERISLDHIRGCLPRVEGAMVELMDRMARTGEVYQLCPGVQDLLDALSCDERFVTSLVTGNVERLAEAKLRVAGIGHHFRERGAFGSDAEERDHLPAIAADRINRSLGRELPAHRFVIVGDTPRDIWCARHFGARVVAVASGQHTVEQLEPHSPDSLLADLSETDAVMKLLAEI
ncbi:MAG: HAD family hydrolase [Acidobacteriota bacterium]